jgi:prophage antirepressor-like protein
MDEEASDFEYWVGEAIRQLMRLAGAEGEPVFTRQRVSNQKEQVEMVATEAQWLDTRTILQMLPNIRPEQVTAIMEAMDGEDSARLGASGGEGE